MISSDDAKRYADYKAKNPDKIAALERVLDYMIRSVVKSIAVPEADAIAAINRGRELNPNYEYDVVPVSVIVRRWYELGRLRS